MMMVDKVISAGGCDALQTSLVETGVVRHKGQALDDRLNLLPNIREHRCIFRYGFLRSQACASIKLGLLFHDIEQGTCRNVS